MTKFTREVVKNYRATMLAEMAEVAKKYGVTAEFGSIRYSDDEFGVKMTVRTNAGMAAIAPRTPRSFTGKITIGTKIYHPARKDPLVVTNISDRGSVFVVSARGAKYRLKMEDALKYAA